MELYSYTIFVLQTHKMNTEIKIGSLVKYAEVVDPSDAYLVYTVVEIEPSTNWIKVQANVDMNIKPTNVGNITDFKLA